MTRQILFATAVLCAIFAATALAADISGNWSGNMNAGGDAIPLSFAFKQDGIKLTGTVISSQNPPLPLNEGKVDGDKISFFVMADMGGTPTKFICEGAIKGDEITLNIKADGGQDFGPSLLKRVK
jgi:hypothetical protein